MENERQHGPTQWFGTWCMYFQIMRMYNAVSPLLVLCCQCRDHVHCLWTPALLYSMADALDDS